MLLMCMALCMCAGRVHWGHIGGLYVLSVLGSSVPEADKVKVLQTAGIQCAKTLLLPRECAGVNVRVVGKVLWTCCGVCVGECRVLFDGCEGEGVGCSDGG